MNFIVRRVVPVFYGNRIEGVGFLWNVICGENKRGKGSSEYIYIPENSS